MEDEKKFKIIELVVILFGIAVKIIAKFANHDIADKYLTNIILLHFIVFLAVIFISMLLSRC
jgi:hypothetical protein